MEEKGTIIDNENFSLDPATNLERFTKVITARVKSADNFNKLKTLFFAKIFFIISYLFILR